MAGLSYSLFRLPFTLCSVHKLGKNNFSTKYTKGHEEVQKLTDIIEDRLKDNLLIHNIPVLFAFLRVLRE
jgi:hypothetical protein